MSWAKHVWHLHPGVRSGRELSIGERCADRVRNGMGSWTFVIIQTVIVAAWMLANGYFLFVHFDKYPFILLNLLFSTQAAYASPIILMSQRRADQQSSETALHTYENTESIKDLIEANTRLTEVSQRSLDANTVLTEQVKDLTGQVHQLVSTKKQPKPAAKGKPTRNK